ncbi:MAG: IS66 family insertion sequence element accessory protein TnpB [Deltaproteobacteria bacterium]|nr:IS66 family insertion sequence element accessory protein TnpB [Deltaproteobacteria bacterium]
MSGARTFVVTQPVDGRKRADSLMAMVRDVLMHDPLSGHFYVFFTRRCDGVRIVYWDRDGIASGPSASSAGAFIRSSRRMVA